MAQANTGVNTARTHELALNLGRTWHFHIGVTALGALIILGLTALLAVAVRLIVVTRRRAREAEAAQRRLEKEIGERKRVEDEMVALNADLKSKEMETIRAQTGRAKNLGRSSREGGRDVGLSPKMRNISADQ